MCDTVHYDKSKNFGQFNEQSSFTLEFNRKKAAEEKSISKKNAEYIQYIDLIVRYYTASAQKKNSDVIEWIGVACWKSCMPQIHQSHSKCKIQFG